MTEEQANKKLEYIKKSLKCPFHIVFGLDNGDVMIWFENDKSDKKNRFSFRGKSYSSAILSGYDYVVNEIQNGYLEDPNKKEKEIKKEEDKDDETK